MARTRACLETGAGRLKTMLTDLGNLPSDPALLQRLLRDMAAAVESRDGEIERLQSIIRKLQRAQFVRRSERLDPDQLALAWKTSMPTSPASGRADTEHPSTIGAAIPMQAAARSSAARGRTARHRSSGLCVLWRRTPYDRREHQRDARLGPGTASRGPHHAPEIRLPCLRDGRASGMPPFQEELICAEWRKSTATQSHKDSTGGELPFPLLARFNDFEGDSTCLSGDISPLPLPLPLLLCPQVLKIVEWCRANSWWMPKSISTARAASLL